MLVRSRIDPIRGQWERIDVDPGMTIAEMVSRANVPDDIRPFMEVSLNGHLVYRHLWHVTRPFQRGNTPTLIEFQVPLAGVGGGQRGGGGGGKSILRAIAGIALLAASAVAPGGFFAVGGLFAKGTLSARLLGAGFAIAASLVMQGVRAPTKDEDDEGPVGFSSGTNDFSPGSGLQRVIGTHRVFPKLVVPPFTTIAGDDSYTTAVYGLAGHHIMSDFKNGEVPLFNGDDILIQQRAGTASDTALTIISDTVIESPVGISMSEHQTNPEEDDSDRDFLKDQTTPANSLPRYHRFRSKKDPYKFIVHFLFDGGLIHLNAGGAAGPRPGGVWIRGRFRLVGAATWKGLPRMFVQNETQRPMRVRIEFRWVSSVPSTATDYWPVDISGNTTYNAHGWAGMIDEPTETVPANWYTRVSGVDGVYYAGVGLQDDQRNLIFYLNTATYPKGTYEFEFQRSRPVFGHHYNIEDDSDDDYFSYETLPGDTHWVHANLNDFSHSLSIPYVQSRWPEHPIDYDVGNPTAYIAVRVRNMNLGRVSCLAQGVLTDEDQELTGVVTPNFTSSNPAIWYLHVLRALHTAEPVPDSRINIAELTDWYEWCEDNNKTVNAVVERKSVVETLQMLAACGFASPRFGAQYGVVIDREQEDGPIGTISARNASDFSIQKPFPPRPHALRVVFNDEQLDYETREITVYDEGYNEDGSGGNLEATKFETVTYEGFTTEAGAQERALHDMRWSRYRSTLRQCTMDIEHLEFQRGDLVHWEDDISGIRGRRARIKEITTNISSQIVRITLDESVHFGSSEGSLYEQSGSFFNLGSGNLYNVDGRKVVALRRRDGVLRYEEVSYYDETYRVLEFLSPFANPTISGEPGFSVGTIVLTGPLGDVARQVLVWDIEPGEDMTATITAVDYVPESMYSVAMLGAFNFESFEIESGTPSGINSQYIPLVL